jgi:hypothetical protein
MSDHKKPADLILTTFYRSGSNFLASHITQTSDIETHQTHKPLLEDTPKATIVRSPEDCLVSALSMWFYYNKHPLDQIKPPRPVRFAPGSQRGWVDESHSLENLIESYSLNFVSLINLYAQFYKYYIDQVDYIFSFEKTVSQPTAVVDELCRLLNKKRSDTNPDLVRPPNDYPKGFFLASSKYLQHYESFKEKISQYDLSECRELYKKALSMAIF